MGLGVIDGFLAGADVPHAPWGDDDELRSQRLVRQLEPDLIVALPRAAVRHGVRIPRGQSYLGFGLERPGDGSAQQIFPLIDGPGTEHGKEVVPGELLPKVHDVQLRCAGGLGFLLQACEVLVLSHVGADGDDLGPCSSP